MDDRLPHPDVLEDGVIEIEFQANDLIKVLVAVGLEAQFRPTSQSLDLSQRQRGRRREGHCAVFDRGKAAHWVRNDVHHQMIEIGFRDIPVASITLVKYVPAPYPLLEDERSSADRRGRIRVSSWVCALVPV